MAATSAKILWPREHGTYGELLFPLMSALLLARPGRAAWGLSLLAVGGFLAHEGFSVLAGARGLRAKRDAHAVAWRSVAIFGGAALLGAAWTYGSTRSALAAFAALLVAGIGVSAWQLGAARPASPPAAVTP